MDRRRFIRSIPAAAAGLLPASAAFAADPAYFVAIEDSAVLIGPDAFFLGRADAKPVARRAPPPPPPWPASRSISCREPI